MALVYGNVKKPPTIVRLIPDVQNGAWNALGVRNIKGIASHTMVGTLWGTDGWFRRGAQSTGLTDFGIGIDGTIFQWNDPFAEFPTTVNMTYNATSGRWEYKAGGTQYTVSRHRSGWANGGSDGLEGDGPLFVRTQGVNAINRDLLSIERDDQGKPYDYPFDGPQFAAFCRLVAWAYDKIKVPWDKFPVNPNLAQAIITYFLHKEFATKGCPWGPVESRVDDAQNSIRGLLKAGQVTDALPIPVEPPKPPEPDHSALPPGYTEAGLEERFGTLTRKTVSGKETKSGFNMKGSISNAWIARGADEGRNMAELPPASYFAESQNAKLLIDDKPATTGIVLFDGRGADNWVLWRPDSSIAWQWMF